jgi:hypothetical protein
MRRGVGSYWPGTGALTQYGDSQAVRFVAKPLDKCVIFTKTWIEGVEPFTGTAARRRSP